MESCFLGDSSSLLFSSFCVCYPEHILHHSFPEENIYRKEDDNEQVFYNPTFQPSISIDINDNSTRVAETSSLLLLPSTRMLSPVR
jgi:hypothetical protein